MVGESVFFYQSVDRIGSVSAEWSGWRGRSCFFFAADPFFFPPPFFLSVPPLPPFYEVPAHNLLSVISPFRPFYRRRTKFRVLSLFRRSFTPCGWHLTDVLCSFEGFGFLTTFSLGRPSVSRWLPERFGWTHISSSLASNRRFGPGGRSFESEFFPLFFAGRGGGAPGGEVFGPFGPF